MSAFSCLPRVTRICMLHKPLIRSSSTAPPLADVNNLPVMPPCDFVPQSYNGPSYDRICEIRRSSLSPALLTYYKRPLLIHQGHMQWLFDHTGRRYLDLFAGIVTVSVGHCHPKVVKTLVDQSQKLWHTTSIYMHPNIHEYADKLTSKLPGDLKVVYFVNSGTEANDMAIQLARLYTGNFDVFSLRNAFHGTSTQVINLTSLSTWKHKLPNMFGFQTVRNPDVYRGIWGGSRCRDSPVQTNRTCDCSPGSCLASDKYIEELDDAMKHGLPKKQLAGMFVESIQGVGGTVQFPRNYVKRAFELVRSNGGVCISDEVQTGFGRTGEHYWGFQMHDVIPDIVTMAKGIGNGFPLAAVVTTPEIAQTLATALHFNTYGGNPLSSAVGSSVMDVIEEEQIQKLCADVGTYFLRELAKLRNSYPTLVGDVRGKGLMIGIELVADSESRAPLPMEQVNAIFEDMKDMGVLVGKGGLHASVLRMKPPMCITKADVDFAVQVMNIAMQNHLSKHN